MAKGKGGKVAMSPEVKALNDEAQTAVGAAEFGKAGELLEKACVAGGNRVELGQQAAQCYCMAKQWKEAVKACTSILDAAPANVQALLTRCQAYEEMGFYKQALADASAVAAFDNAPLDALKYKTRIEETIAANKAKLASTTHGAPRGMAGGMGGGGGSGANANAAAAAAANAAAVAAAAPRSKVQIPSSLSVKVTLEGETRLANVSLNTLTYPELLDAVAAKFPGAHPECDEGS
ncbi:hypothetical protein FOA52_000785 [Chlamydomonas sp. UWO 241]|nr:hypothetical protein FOA52_000785 [Chlamydomonas sp. UWO 241]